MSVSPTSCAPPAAPRCTACCSAAKGLSPPSLRWWTRRGEQRCALTVGTSRTKALTGRSPARRDRITSTLDLGPSGSWPDPDSLPPPCAQARRRSTSAGSPTREAARVTFSPTKMIVSSSYRAASVASGLVASVASFGRSPQPQQPPPARRSSAAATALEPAGLPQGTAECVPSSPRFDPKQRFPRVDQVLLLAVEMGDHAGWRRVVAAALRIQRHWRGWQCRRLVYNELVEAARARRGFTNPRGLRARSSLGKAAAAADPAHAIARLERSLHAQRAQMLQMSAALASMASYIHSRLEPEGGSGGGGGGGVENMDPSPMGGGARSSPRWVEAMPPFAHLPAAPATGFATVPGLDLRLQRAGSITALSAADLEGQGSPSGGSAFAARLARMAGGAAPSGLGSGFTTPTLPKRLNAEESGAGSREGTGGQPPAVGSVRRLITAMQKDG